ncbi:LAETG motif-containing sortase-dependent surface protein [Streptomyces sp. NPDC055210]
MNLFRKSASAAVAALALAALSVTTAEAHDGLHPFKNCAEAYENGYSDIVKGDDHYGEHLDHDKDGIGCDKPSADFVPVDDRGAGAEEPSSASSEQPKQPVTDLAETGGSGVTPYLAGGGALVFLAGGGVLVAARRRGNSG